MELKGTIIMALPEVSGISKAGNAWKKRDYVLENNEGNFPRKVAFTCFGANADNVQLNVGDKVIISFDLESREYNGRWYTEVRCWRAVPDTDAAPAVAAAPAAAPAVAAPAAGVAAPPQMPAGFDDDLPF